MNLFDKELPEATNSYTPVAHKTITNLIEDELTKVDLSYIHTAKVNRNGDIACGTYSIGEGEFTASISWLNSYNKRSSVKIASGLSTSVCTNTQITGQITWCRRHTGEVEEELREMVKEHINGLSQLKEDTLDWYSELKEIKVNKTQQSELLGRLLVTGILNPTQCNIVAREINKPSYDYGSVDSLYVFNQHCTHALKKVHPQELMKRQENLRNFIIQAQLELS